MGLGLRSLGTLTLTMTPPLVLAGTPSGTRVVVEFPTIRWEGERLRGARHGSAAADWITVGPEGTATLDIRFLLATDDGAVVYVHGGGRTDSAGFARGAPVYFAPCFETADPRYAWLNRVQAVARGLTAGDTVTFEVCEVC